MATGGDVVKRRDRKIAQIRNEAIRTTLQVADLFTAADLHVVDLALQDRARIHQGTPAGEAADRVLVKLHQQRTTR